MINSQTTVSSIGLIALADYISSPSSYGSEFDFSQIPAMLFGGETQTQIITEEEEEAGGRMGYQMIWLKKPYNRRRPLPKIK